MDKENYDPPLGLCYIASYLKKEGFEDVIIVDKEDEMRRIRNENPDIVGITASSLCFSKANRLAGLIKAEMDIPTIIGGVHITSLPNQFKRSNFDIAVLGEGERTMTELMEKELSKPSTIKGLLFRENGKIIRTEPREFIENLDVIPYPARDLLQMKKYLTPRASVFHGELVTATGIITSRGCPYNCVFCASSFWQRNVRFHSAKYVVGEIKELTEKYHINHVIVWDDLFVANKNRIKEIHDLILKEKIDVSFVANARANIINKEICKLLSEMNVKNLSFGFESASEKILKYLKTGSVTVEQNKTAVRLCREFGIKVNGFFIIGSPNETEEDLKKTMDFAKTVDSFSAFQLTPFPATLVWEYAKQKGIVNDDITDFSFAQIVKPEFKPEIAMNDKELIKKWFFRFQEESKKKGGIKIKSEYFRYVFSWDFWVAVKRKFL